MPGRFITLEGGEGVGKSTQARLLAQTLASAGIPVLLTREPGGAPGSEKLRQLLVSRATEWAPLADIMLHFAARAEHVENLIRRALAAGIWVICDRYYDSTMAYQGYGLGGDLLTIKTLAHLIKLDPDLTVILDLPVHAGMLRVAWRGKELDRYERMGNDFFARVRQGFLDIADACPDRCTIVSAAGDKETVAERIRLAIHSRLAVPLAQAA